MKPARGIESDGDYPRVVLSMRVKISVVGLCFVLAMSLLVYSNVPYAVQALRGLAQGADLVENESQPPEQESSPESQAPGDWVTLFFDDFDPPPIYKSDGDIIFVDEAGDPIWVFMNWYGTGTASRILVQNGSLFLLIVSGQGHNRMRLTGDYFLPSPVGIEMRIRIREGDTAECGFWGDYGFLLDNGICAGHEDLIWGSVECNKSLEIDVTEWHNYTVLKDGENVTFLIDGEIFGTIKDDNPGYSIPELVGSVEVDYIRIYTKERFWRDFYELLLNTKEALDEMGRMDIPPFYVNLLISLYGIESEFITSLESGVEFDETSEDTNIDLMRWLYRGYEEGNVHRALRLNWIEPRLEYFDDFCYVGEITEKAEAMGIHEQLVMNMKSDYEEAFGRFGGAKVEFDPYLQSILHTAQTYFDIEVAESALLPILGFALLPALLRRRNP